jgi:hypothetical protein
MESIHWSRFLGSLKVQKHHLCSFWVLPKTKGLLITAGRAGYHFKHAEVEDKQDREEWYQWTEKEKNEKGGLREIRERIKKEFKREKEGEKSESK